MSKKWDIEKFLDLEKVSISFFDGHLGHEVTYQLKRKWYTHRGEDFSLMEGGKIWAGRLSIDGIEMGEEEYRDFVERVSSYKSFTWDTIRE